MAARRVRFKFDKPASEKSRKYAEALLAEVRRSVTKLNNAAIADILSRAALPADATQWEVSSLIDKLRSARSVGYDMLWTESALMRVATGIADAIARDRRGDRITDADRGMAYLALEESVARIEELTS